MIDTGIVTRVLSGTRIEGLAGGGWIQRHNIHGFYWFDRPYNLLEVYRTDGALEEVYIHIASPARLEHKLVRYTDHELDVVMRAGEEPRVVDEEDFVQAALAYGYPPRLPGRLPRGRRRRAPAGGRLDCPRLHRRRVRPKVTASAMWLRDAVARSASVGRSCPSPAPSRHRFNGCCRQARDHSSR